AEWITMATAHATVCTTNASTRTGRRRGNRRASQRIAGVMSAQTYHPVGGRPTASQNGIGAPRIRSETYVADTSASAAIDHTATIVSMDTRRARIVPNDVTIPTL